MSDEIVVEPTLEELRAENEHYKTSFESTNTQLKSMAEELEKFKMKASDADKHKKAREREAQAAIEEAARKGGDIEALEKSWNDKYGSLESTSSETIATLNSVIHNVTVGAEAKAIASELAVDGSSGVLIPHIQSRLTMELVNGNPVIKVLQNGLPSALTLDDLKKEIAENKAFAPIIRGSSADGSGKLSNISSGGKNTIKRGQFDSLSHTEKSRFIREGGKVVD